MNKKLIIGALMSVLGTSVSLVAMPPGAPGGFGLEGGGQQSEEREPLTAHTRVGVYTPPADPSLKTAHTRVGVYKPPTEQKMLTARKRVGVYKPPTLQPKIGSRGRTIDIKIPSGTFGGLVGRGRRWGGGWTEPVPTRTVSTAVPVRRTYARPVTKYYVDEVVPQRVTTKVRYRKGDCYIDRWEQFVCPVERERESVYVD